MMDNIREIRKACKPYGLRIQLRFGFSPLYVVFRPMTSHDICYISPTTPIKDPESAAMSWALIDSFGNLDEPVPTWKPE